MTATACLGGTRTLSSAQLFDITILFYKIKSVVLAGRAFRATRRHRVFAIQRLHSAQLSNSTRLQPKAGVCIHVVHRRHEPSRVGVSSLLYNRRGGCRSSKPRGRGLVVCTHPSRGKANLKPTLGPHSQEASGLPGAQGAHILDSSEPSSIPSFVCPLSHSQLES